MNETLKQYLYFKNVLVCERDHDCPDAFEAAYSMYRILGVKIVRGAEHAGQDLLQYLAQQLGENVHEPFYRGFPQSVRALAPDALVYDQMLHYFHSYGLGDFSTAGHSLFEQPVARTEFEEAVEPTEFSIVTEEEAAALLRAAVEGLLSSSRPLSSAQYLTVREYLLCFGDDFPKCASKNTAVRLLLDTRSLSLARFLYLSDVIKLVSEMQYALYRKKSIKKLNLKNRDRKLLTETIDRLFALGHDDVRNCLTRKADWQGLLHHLHYRPKCENAARFLISIRGKEERSVYSDFEREMKKGNATAACSILYDEKGGGAVARHLDYLLSRCESEEDFSEVLEKITKGNRILLLQLLMKYAASAKDEQAPAPPEGRFFRFTRFRQTVVHAETPEEAARRTTVLSPRHRKAVGNAVASKLRAALSGTLGRVYVDEEMKRYTLPLSESDSQGGAGVLPKGTRLPLPEGKKIRAFTYWEKVPDIDLSLFALNADGSTNEFSWRTMALEQSAAVTYSGDQTSGFNGGSEYFDVDPVAFRKLYPEARYLVFCNNVFSDLHFCDCLCKAGYMLRDAQDSGEVFEPKTIRSSFTVNCDSTFAYLFGFDLQTNEFVWLNLARQSGEHVAGRSRLDFLTPWFEAAGIMNLYAFYEMAATELVSRPEEADVVVAAGDLPHKEGALLARPCDFDVILRHMNG